MSKVHTFDKAMDYIDANIGRKKQEIKEGFYEYLGYSSVKISTFITILTGSLSLDWYIIKRKLYFAAKELENYPDKKVSEIGEKYYSESSRFSTEIKNYYGYTPKQIQRDKPTIPDNRLYIEDYIDKPTSYLSKVLDHYKSGSFDQCGYFEEDYLKSYIDATNEFGFSTETCCLISVLSQHMNIPFAYMLEKMFDIVIDMHMLPDDFPKTIEEEVAFEFGVKSIRDLNEICIINNMDFVYDITPAMVKNYYDNE